MENITKTSMNWIYRWGDSCVIIIKSCKHFNYDTGKFNGGFTIMS